MGEVTTIGLDLAKHDFQVHGVDAEGATVLRKQLRRAQVLAFFSRLPPCLVGLEACATAHYWARELRALGHERQTSTMSRSISTISSQFRARLLWIIDLLGPLCPLERRDRIRLVDAEVSREHPLQQPRRGVLAHDAVIPGRKNGLHVVDPTRRRLVRE